MRRIYACRCRCGILSKRFPQLAAVCLGAVNVAHIVCTAVIHGIALVKGGIQCRGAVIPVFQYGGGLSGVLVQLVQHTGIRNQIALEQEISRDGIAVGGAIAAAAAGDTAGCTAYGIQRQCGLRGSGFAFLHGELGGRCLKAACLDSQRVLTLVFQVVCTVFCGFVVVQNEQILTEQIVIVNVRQFMLCTGRIGQRYLLNWVGNAVNQIAYRKVQVFAGFRLFLNLKGWSLCIYNMNRNQC